MFKKVPLLIMMVGACMAQGPVIFRQEMPDQQCVKISDDYPQNKTVYVDSCSKNRVCNFQGPLGKFIWPLRQTDIVGNSSNYRYKYNNAGTATFGYLDAYCTDRYHLSLGSKYSGERCTSDNQGLSGLCSNNKCLGFSLNDPCEYSGEGEIGLWCQNNKCTATVANGVSCSSDDECDAENIGDVGSGVCNYAFYESFGTIVRDARRCQSGVKRNADGSSGSGRTTTGTRQGGTSDLLWNKGDPTSATTGTLRDSGGVNQLTAYSGFLNYAYTIANPTDGQGLYENVGYGIPIGNSDWITMHTYWQSTILPGIKDTGHQTRRFNPIAWPDCQSGLTETQMAYFANYLYENTNSGYLEEDNQYSDFIETINIFSPQNWVKIGLSSSLSALSSLIIFSCMILILQ